MDHGNPFGHIDLRVSSLNEALPFYEAVLPTLGFTQRHDGPTWKVFANEVEPPRMAYLGIRESPKHQPNENRVAFWVCNPIQVDRIASVIAAAHGRGVSGPKRMPYGPEYYAVFFCDPSGNRLEVYHQPAR